MKEISETDYLRLTSEEFKACKGCKHRMKDKGTISRQAGESVGEVYGCGLGQMNGLTKELAYLPEQCRARNLARNIDKIRYQFSVPKKQERDNCRVCQIYSDEKPTCKDERINFMACPCKTCEKFMRTEQGCMNFTEECRKAFKFTYKEVETTK